MKIASCVLLAVSIIVLEITLFLALQRQQCQIDQLCQMMVTLVDSQELATEEMDLIFGKKYGFYFGDYGRGIAILEELDPKIPGYAKRNPHWVILRGVSKKTLDEWSSIPLSYGKYREIKD